MSGRVRMAENGAQLFSRIGGRRSLKEIDQNIFPENGGPVQGDVIEFHGVEGSGKTETLYHLVCRCILPACAGGLEVEVMFIDTDHHFDMLRLVSVLETRLTAAAAQEVEELMRSALRRLSVLHCSSSSQLLLTLHSLEGVFCGRPALCLLVIDSVSSFYWPDRAGGGDSLARQEANLRKSIEILDRLRRDYGVVVFATTHAIMRNYSSSSTSDHQPGTSTAPWRSVSDFDRPYLCRSWQKALTHRLVFAKHTAKDALRVHRAHFSVVCSSVRIKAAHRSDFYVTEGGLCFHK